jgi:hypothetical protein
VVRNVAKKNASGVLILAPAHRRRAGADLTAL